MKPTGLSDLRAGGPHFGGVCTVVRKSRKRWLQQAKEGGSGERPRVM